MSTAEKASYRFAVETAISGLEFQLTYASPEEAAARLALDSASKITLEPAKTYILRLSITEYGDAPADKLREALLFYAQGPAGPRDSGARDSGARAREALGLKPGWEHRQEGTP